MKYPIHVVLAGWEYEGSTVQIATYSRQAADLVARRCAEDATSMYTDIRILVCTPRVVETITVTPVAYFGAAS